MPVRLPAGPGPAPPFDLLRRGDSSLRHMSGLRFRLSVLSAVGGDPTGSTAAWLPGATGARAGQARWSDRRPRGARDRGGHPDRGRVGRRDGLASQRDRRPGGLRSWRGAVRTPVRHARPRGRPATHPWGQAAPDPVRPGPRCTPRRGAAGPPRGTRWHRGAARSADRRCPAQRQRIEQDLFLLAAPEDPIAVALRRRRAALDDADQQAQQVDGTATPHGAPGAAVAQEDQAW
jgi:hypothetical protein